MGLVDFIGTEPLARYHWYVSLRVQLGVFLTETLREVFLLSAYLSGLHGGFLSLVRAADFMASFFSSPGLRPASGRYSLVLSF